jgi:putative component of membrane protein insertase Oxa1/YidC/SpoIIIJ protein YidD
MRKWLFILIFWPFALPLEGNPWGKDADLALHCHSTCDTTPTRCKTPILGLMGEVLINFHQEVISPCDGPRSHYKPSSSQYTLEAMRKYDFLTGMAMGCDRLMRENNEEWVYRIVRDGAGKPIKYDPVP